MLAATCSCRRILGDSLPFCLVLPRPGWLHQTSPQLLVLTGSEWLCSLLCTHALLLVNCDVYDVVNVAENLAQAAPGM